MTVLVVSFLVAFVLAAYLTWTAGRV
ncbi:MAG: hypothetical protein JWN54_3572, partial [Mycobacterium sp.]|nr:hypothetical protein [Mycobacterium sp.]